MALYMSEVIVIAEGQSEQSFLKRVLAPYLSEHVCYIRAQLIGTPGHKGGSVSFDRFSRDVGAALKQRKDTYISSMLDYFRLDSKWPGMNDLNQAMRLGRKIDKSEIRVILQEKTLERLEELFPQYSIPTRVLPYFSMHEFESLLFSDVTKLSEGLRRNIQDVQYVLDSFDGDPESINTDPSKAPSKVLERLNPEYKKVLQGTLIATSIGIPKMQNKCSCFNHWINQLLALS